MSESSAKKRTINKKALKITLWCILGVIVLLLVIVLGSLLVQKYIKKSDVPMFMGYGSMIVVTGSMSGTIEKGDLIIVKKVDEYKLGDIVTYVEAKGKTPVTHRLVRYGPEEGTFIAKGDANPSTDIYPVTEEQIAGKVVTVIPKVGLFFDWLVDGLGIIYVIAMIAIVVAGVYFFNSTKPTPEANEETTNAPDANGNSTDSSNSSDTSKAETDNSTDAPKDKPEDTETKDQSQDSNKQ